MYIELKTRKRSGEAQNKSRLGQMNSTILQMYATTSLNGVGGKVMI